jgi:hypothetical protein
MALTSVTWTTSADGRGLRPARRAGAGTKRVVRPNSLGGTDTYTRWRARGTTFLHVRSTTTAGGPTFHWRFSHKAANTDTIHWKAWGGSDTTKAKSWRMANGVITEHKRSLHANGVRVSERTTYGKRSSTGTWKNSLGMTGRTRRWNLNSRQMVHHVSSPKAGGGRDYMRIITEGRAGPPHIRTLYERASAMFK